MSRRLERYRAGAMAWLAELDRDRRRLAESLAAAGGEAARAERAGAERRAWIAETERALAGGAAVAAAPGAAPSAAHERRAPAPAAAPAVSIVTPYYNAGPRFAETLDSVLAQSLGAWEWILVNDGSTDPAALAALDRALAADPRVRVLDHPRNLGAGAARNTGFAAARAPYVLQLDADDRLEPTAAEKWLWHLHTHPDAAFVNGWTICHGAIDAVWTKGFEQGDAFLRQNFVGGRGMVRRRAHAEVGGYDPELPLALEDWDFWLRCADAGFWGTTLEEALDWQHRRGSDAEQWPDWDGGARQAAAVARMSRRYPRLVARGVPRLPPRWPLPCEPIALEAPCANPFPPGRPRLVLIVAWLAMGGTDRFNLDLIDELVARGWDVTVVTTLRSADEWRHEYRARTGDLFMLPRFLEPRHYPAFLRYVIESRRPQAVMVSHSEMAYRLLPALRAWCPGPAWLDYLHILEPTWKSGGYPRMSALFRDQLDLTLVSNERLRDWMIEQGTSAERVDVLRTAIDTELHRPDAERRAAVRERLGLAPERPAILFAGRLCEQKRPLLVARAMARLAERGVDAVALVAGDGELRAELEREIAQRGVGDRVRLLGALPPDELRGVMAASDVFFLPSEREGISLSLLEAMASGLAAVATDVGGQRELVVEGAGLLLPAGDDESALARYVDALEELCRDPARRSALGTAARERVIARWSRRTLGEQAVAALERARRRAAESPRPAADPVAATRAGDEAVETMRINDLCDWLWLRHLELERRQAAESAAVPAAAATSTVPAAAPLAARTASVGARLFALLKRTSEPVYVWGIRNGWRWLVPVKERVKARMLRAPQPG